MAKNFNKKDTFSARVNDEIKYEEARVIYKEHSNTESENDFNKIMRVSSARHFAENRGLDLIEINGKTNPPILRIYDYTKYVWEMKQNDKKKKSNVTETKEIQLSVNISKHDMETKAKHALDFLSKGKNVKVVLMMRGRELSRREESSKSFYEFLAMMGEDIAYVSAPKDEGNKIIAILKKKK